MKGQAKSREAQKAAAFGRDKRLLKHSAFDRVYTTGRRQFSPAMSAFYLLYPAKAVEVRVGFTVGRVIGGAVQRNRIKRRMREAVRRELPQLRSALAARQLGAEIVFNPRRKVLDMEFAALQQEVMRVFQGIAGGPPTTAESSEGKEQP